MIGMTATGDWTKAASLLQGFEKRLKDASRKALLQEGQYFRGKIVEGIRDQAPGGKAFAPLSENTIATRVARRFGGSKALIVRGDLMGAITTVEDRDGVFVGVLRSATNSDGKELVNVAAVHEFGAGPYVIQMTDKMRRFLHWALGDKGGESSSAASTGGKSTGIIVVQIPARPFLRPVFESETTPPEKMAKRYLARVAELLGGDFGTVGFTPAGT